MPSALCHAALFACLFFGACGPAGIATAINEGGGGSSSDGPPPLELTVLSGPAAATNSTSATFTFTSNRAETKFAARFDGAQLGQVQSPHTLLGIQRGSHEFVLTASTPDRQMRSVRYPWVMDPDPPVTTLASRPDRFSASTTAQFDLRAEQGSTFKVGLDSGPLDPLDGTTVSFSGLNEGAHRLEAEATDPAGNVEAPRTDYEWTVDVTPPDPPAALTATPRGAAVLELAWPTAADPGRSASGVSEYRVYYGFDSSYGGTTANEGASPITVSAPSTSLTLTALDACRDFHLTVRSVDRAGNESAIGFGAVQRTGCGGDGTFGAPVFHAVGTAPSAAAVVDVNRDGHPDVAVANSGSGDFTLLVNRGDGTFRAALDPRSGRPAFAVAAPGDPRAIEPTDLDDDGILDLIVGTRVETPPRTGISLLFGTGANGVWDGGFDEPMPGSPGGALGALRTLRFSSLQFEGSRDIFILTDDRFHIVTVRRGGPPFFDENPVVVCFPISGPYAAFDLAGLDSALRPSLDVPAALDDGRFAALLNRGIAQNSLQLCGSLFASGRGPTALRARDLNEDGIVDAVIAGAGSSGLDVFVGIGSGIFEPPVTYRTAPSPVDLALVDVDDDDVLDTVTAHRGGSVVVRLGVGRDGVGDGTLGGPRSFASGGNPAAIATADFDDDEIDDVLVVDRANDRVGVLPGVGRNLRWNRALREPTAFAAGLAPEFLELADVNGDGILDLIQLNRPAATLGVQFGLGSGTRGLARFGRPIFTPVGIEEGTVNQLEVADVDADGVPDAFVTAFDLGSNRTLLLRGRRDGRFDPWTAFSTGPDAPLCVGSVASADFNGDGRLDVVMSNFRIFVYLQDPGGGFGARITTDLPFNCAEALEPADLDGDGHVDLVLLDTDEIIVFRGDGTGAMALQLRAAHGREVRAVRARDLDRDGLVDVLLLAPPGVQVWRGRGVGPNGIEFDPPQSFPAGSATLEDLATADLDEDGVLDVAITHRDVANPGISILRGRGDASFEAVLTFPRDPLHQAGSIAIADLDKDLVLDLVIGDPTDAAVVVYRGGGNPR